MPIDPLTYSARRVKSLTCTFKPHDEAALMQLIICEICSIAVVLLVCDAIFWVQTHPAAKISISIDIALSHLKQRAPSLTLTFSLLRVYDEQFIYDIESKFPHTFNLTTLFTGAPFLLEYG